MKEFIVSEELLTATIRYLLTCPMAQVEQLVNALRQSDLAKKGNVELLKTEEKNDHSY